MPAQADQLLRVATAGDPEPAALLAIIERDPALAERWAIPTHLVEAVAAHHSPAMNTNRPDLATLLFAAEVLCDSFLPPVDGGGVDALVVLEGLGAARPEAMALRVRDAVLTHVTDHDLMLKGV